jgi:DNA-binding LacI/PurR family transcriptional regulator
MEANQMDKKLTIDDIARELQVSKTTVSRAISGKGRIGENTKKRVQDYIKEHNYRPSLLAKGLANCKTYNIGYVMPDSYQLADLPFFQQCLIGICSVAAARDYDVLLTLLSWEDISAIERLVDNRKVDGVILSRTHVGDKATEYLLAKGLPFVTIGTMAGNKDIVQVDNDHRSACKELTASLLNKGNHKLGLIGGSQAFVVTGKRLQGYMDAFLDRGLSVDRSLIYMDAMDGLAVENAVEGMLRKGVECIICMDDAICTYVLKKLRLTKIKVPKEVKVASFYSSTILENNIPSVTTLKFDVRQLGAVTCQTLLDHMAGKSVPCRTLLGYEVIWQESTQNA